MKYLCQNLINHYLKAFEEEQRKRQAGEYTSRTNRNFDSEKSKDYSGGGSIHMKFSMTGQTGDLLI
jgi:hypothetical protein